MSPDSIDTFAAAPRTPTSRLLRSYLKTILSKNGEPAATAVEQAQSLHFLRHHLCTTLKNEYMTERNPKVLWDSLRNCFEQIKAVLLRRLYYVAFQHKDNFRVNVPDVWPEFLED